MRRSTKCAPICAPGSRKPRSSASALPSPPPRRRKVALAQEEHFACGLLRVEPDERQLGEFAAETLAAAAGLAHERALRAQMIRRAAQDAAHNVEPVRSAGMRDPWFGRIFGRKVGERLSVDVRRVGENEVVALALERGEEIALDESHARLKPMLLDIAPGDLERVRREVNGVDQRMGKDTRGEDGERAPASAEVEDALFLVGVAGQRVVFGERGHEEFADEAARHDHALVNIERHALDVGAVHEIGGGLAGRDARLDQRVEPLALAPQELGVGERIERIDREMEGFENEEGRFVDRVRRAVAESEASGAKAADGITKPVARRQEERDALVGLAHPPPPLSSSASLKTRAAGLRSGLPPRSGTRSLTRRACIRA